ncbi:MAG: GntR family transcriptional regulator [Verrucomicrobiales bacterium]|nr:GntR family transcriptional regulator [Verrucomicrobiales bacterium]
MKTVQRESVASKTTELLRREIKLGALRGKLPGVRKLATDLNVSRDNVRTALLRLETEGWLRSAKHGRAREVAGVPPRGAAQRRVLRVGVLIFEPLMAMPTILQRLIMSIHHRMEAAGHSVTLITERGQPSEARLKRAVDGIEADAWVLHRASRPVMQWFVDRGVPVYAAGGMAHGLPIAASSIHLARAVEQAVDEFVRLGHRRIVLIAAAYLRKPVPSSSIARFIEVMGRHGIKVDNYHLPDWEETPAGLQRLLASLFKVTPPTAIIVEAPTHMLGTLAFLKARNLGMPGQVSFAVMFPDATFEWWQPTVSHFRWNEEPFFKHLERWLGRIAEGHTDVSQRHVEAVFVKGGTTGRPE